MSGGHRIYSDVYGAPVARLADYSPHELRQIARQTEQLVGGGAIHDRDAATVGCARLLPPV